MIFWQKSLFGGCFLSAASAAGPCRIRQRLTEELKRNHAALAHLSARQFEAVLRNDWETNRSIEAERPVLEAQRRSIILQLLEHVTEHGC